jgi:hypothetical protein
MQISPQYGKLVSVADDELTFLVYVAEAMLSTARFSLIKALVIENWLAVG